MSAQPRWLIFEKQGLHIGLLAALLAGIAYATELDAVRSGFLWGIATPGWIGFAVAVAVIHQTYVWFCWRTQLHGPWLTRAFGAHGFTLYAVGFSVIAITRVTTVFLVAIASQDTLPGDAAAWKFLAVVVLLPAAYLFYSVKRYFGFKRAFGIDHFDASYTTMPLERRGIFRFTRNGMYTFGLLLLWVPAFWWASAAALCVAAFNHLYIWVHYFSTERPDMRRIYGIG